MQIKLLYLGLLQEKVQEMFVHHIFIYTLVCQKLTATPGSNQTTSLGRRDEHSLICTNN